MRRFVTLFPKLLVGVAILAAIPCMTAGEAGADFSTSGYQSNFNSLLSSSDYFSASAATGATITYDGSANFTVTGAASAISGWNHPGHTPLSNTSFSIAIDVAPGGNSWNSINSTDLIIKQGSTNLLTGSLTTFGLDDYSGNSGASGPQDTLEFIFKITGGATSPTNYLSAFGGIGSSVGFFLPIYQSSTDINFHSLSQSLNISALLNGEGELAPMAVTPLPASIYMFLSGLIGLGLLRRFRRA